MWQTLLADRFKLRLHRENERAPCLCFDCRGRTASNCRAAQRSRMRFFSTRHDAATQSRGRSIAAMSPAPGPDSRQALVCWNEGKQGPHGGLDQRACISAGPASLGSNRIHRRIRSQSEFRSG